ncbi:MAG TPA: hypothetical protein VJ301_03975 [Propionibacteriaceae bacterium]|nr:hypothetical protein [Propionibacteriaceae bacterium]
MLTRVVVWSAFVLAVAVFCLVRPQAARLFVGVFFGVMGLGVHGFLVIRNPEGYVGFAEQALIRWYRQIGLFLTTPNPRAFGIVMLILEVTLAALILSRGRWVKVGIVGAILFLVGISPLGFDIMPNLLLAAALVYLLTQDFPRDAWTMLRDRHRRGTAIRASNREPQGHNSFRS